MLDKNIIETSKLYRIKNSLKEFQLKIYYKM